MTVHLRGRSINDQFHTQNQKQNIWCHLNRKSRYLLMELLLEDGHPGSRTVARMSRSFPISLEMLSWVAIWGIGAFNLWRLKTLTSRKKTEGKPVDAGNGASFVWSWIQDDEFDSSLPSHMSRCSLNHFPVPRLAVPAIPGCLIRMSKG